MSLSRLLCRYSFSQRLASSRQFSGKPPGSQPHGPMGPLGATMGPLALFGPLGPIGPIGSVWSIRRHNGPRGAHRTNGPIPSGDLLTSGPRLATPWANGCIGRHNGPIGFAGPIGPMGPVGPASPMGPFPSATYWTCRPRRKRRRSV